MLTTLRLISRTSMLCMGAQASIVPESFSWLSCVASFAQRREPIPPVSVGWVAMSQSHACGLQKVFIATYLSFREVKPRVPENRCLNKKGVWSCAEGTASKESGKESCVIELAIKGLIEGGSITQHKYHLFCQQRRNHAGGSRGLLLLL